MERETNLPGKLVIVNSELTATHIFVALELGYEKKNATEKRVNQAPRSPKTKKHIAEKTAKTSPPFRTPPRKNEEQHPEFPPENQYFLLPSREKCGGCICKGLLIQKYQKKKLSI